MGEIIIKRMHIILIAILCNILWGSAFPVIKIVYNEIGVINGQINLSILFAGIRFFAASIILLLIYRLSSKERVKIPKGRNLLIIFIIGILQTFIHYIFFFWGLVNVSGSKASILVASEVFFVFLFAHILFANEKITRIRFLGLILGFFGVVIVNMDGQINIDFNMYGEGFMLLSAFSNSMSIIFIKKYTKNTNIIYITGWQMLLGSALLLAIGIITTGNERIIWTPLAIVLLVYSILLSIIAFGFWNLLIKRYSIIKISIYKFLMPVFGSFFSFIFLPHEKFNVKTLISLLFVVLGILLIYHKVNNQMISKGEKNDNTNM
jgi:drug/metabolite transporter (DMT)-like permease